MSDIKGSQLTRVGYRYQDLICIQVLIEWFHNPARYQWVSIEGSRDAEDIKSLDDVVAFTREGKYELYQVKFTVDASRPDLALDYDWLLRKKEKGTSFLQKWQKDYARYSAGDQIETARLITNRRPDPEIEACLKGNRLEIEKLSESRLREITEQLGGYEQAKTFLDAFIFDHSQPEIEGLEGKLMDSLVPDHSTQEGWLSFLKAVEKWATHKDQPLPDGKIRLAHLYRHLALPGQTIAQYFDIPDNYTPPTSEFHANVVAKTKASGCWVVTGLPGMGKSTYLSYLTQILDRKIPVIRHHYSVSAQAGEDRISFVNAAKSLQFQLSELYPDQFSREFDPNDLEKWVRRGAAQARKDGKVLIVIVDGLDHVHRERASNIEQLNHLINRLAPLSDELCLLLGTQPVSDAQLPNCLAAYAPRDKNWIDIPAMDMVAIRRWIEALVEENEELVGGNDDYRTGEIGEIARALHDISHGYPLHIHYSLSSLIIKEGRLSSYSIERLPACPEGDITKYYGILWGHLSATAREILSLIACVDFPWPDKVSLGSCFTEHLRFREAYDEIQHLVEQRRSGLIPFHGSVIVYLRSQTDYQVSEIGLLQRVKIWLATSAPEYWRWGWKWVIDAKLGDNSQLISGITRHWSVDSLCMGYPTQHIEQMISMAERLAFDSDQFDEMVRLRLIKIRLLNGPEYQVQDFAEFLRSALAWKPNSFGALWRADHLRVLTDKELPMISTLLESSDPTILDEALEEIKRRLEFYVKGGGHSDGQKIDGLITSYLDILTEATLPDVRKIFDFIDLLRDKDDYFLQVLQKLYEAGNTASILEVPKERIPEGLQQAYYDYFVLACCREGILVSNRPESSELKVSPLGVIKLYLEGKPIETKDLVSPIAPAEVGENVSFRYFHNLFFYFLALQLENIQDAVNPSSLKDTEKAEYLSKAGKAIEFLAHVIAKRIRAGEEVSLTNILESMSSVDMPMNPPDYQIQGIHYQVRKSLYEIFLIIDEMAAAANTDRIISKETLEVCTASRWWDHYAFLDRAASVRPRRLSREFIKTELERRLQEIRQRKDSTSDLANDSIDLARMARTFGFRGQAEEAVLLAAENILGYGWRKDTTAYYMYEAIEACSAGGIGDIPGWLRRLGAFTEEIAEFTEREINSIPGRYIDLLAKHSPERLVDEYEFQIDTGNWSKAADIVNAIIEQFPLNTPAEHALLSCQTTKESLDKIAARAASEPSLQPIYEDLLLRVGQGLPDVHERHFTNTEEKVAVIDFDDFPPEKISEIFDELQKQGIYSTDKTIEKWIDHWKKKGNVLHFLNVVRQLCEANGSLGSRIGRNLHDFFNLSLDVEGKAKALWWAIKDSKDNSHWSGYMGDHAEQCMNRYGEIFKDQWKSFLKETMLGEGYRFSKSEELIIPSSGLVLYLIHAGQQDLAARITEVMVASLEAEIAYLPISPLHWGEVPVARSEVVARILLKHFQWPDRYSRLRTASAIAVLLQHDEGFRPLYLNFAGALLTEVGVGDFLSILQLVDDPLFTEEQLTEKIAFPSCLSDLIMLELGFFPDTVEKHYTKLTPADYRDSESFRKARDHGIPLMYLDLIRRLGKKVNYPLLDHMAAEWEVINERRSVLFFMPYYFYGSMFSRSEKLSHLFSSEIETAYISAYLRTLAFALNELSALPDEVEEMIGYARPFHGFMHKVSPATKPVAWPEIKVDKDDALPMQLDLERYLNELMQADRVLVRAHGPVLRDHTGVCCDLSVTLIYLDESVTLTPHQLHEKIVAKDNADEHRGALASSGVPGFLGRWEVNLWLRGFFSPKYSIATNAPRSTTYTDSSYDYRVGGKLIASWKYWIQQWYPVWYQGVDSPYGTYIESERSLIKGVREETGMRLYYLAKLSMFDNRRYTGENKASRLYALVPFV